MSHTRYRIASAGKPRPFPPEAMARIQEILARYPTKQAALLPVLWVAQETFGWISKESAEEVARILDLPPSHVDGVLTFYTMYNLHPVGTSPAPGLHVHFLPPRRRGRAHRALQEAAGHRARGDHEGRQVHDGRGRVHRRMRPRSLDDGQRQILRADGREEARRAARPALGEGLSRGTGASRSRRQEGLPGDGRLSRRRRVRGVEEGRRRRPHAGAAHGGGQEVRASRARRRGLSLPASSGASSRRTRRASRFTSSATPTSPSPERSRTAS